MKYPNILILGPSGSGKSNSFRNMDPETTVILNMEQRILPFRNAIKFKRQRDITDYEQFKKLAYGDPLKAQKGAYSADNTEAIINDSLTSLIEQIGRKVAEKYKGYDYWAKYGDEIYNVLFEAKKSEKFVIFTSVEDIVQDENNLRYRSPKVEGKKMSGDAIVKEFDIVLHTTVNVVEGKSIYQFETNNDGTHPAKSPEGMLDRFMDNDLNLVIQKIKEYYGTETN